MKLVRRFPWLVACLLLTGTLPAQVPSNPRDARGAQFLDWTNFAPFQRTTNAATGDVTLLSPAIHPRVEWNELVASWNTALTGDARLRIEVLTGTQNQGEGQPWVLGLWSADPRLARRESVPGQRNAAGEVATDTLKLQRPAGAFRVRLVLGGRTLPRLEFFGVSLLDTRVRPPALPPNRAAWGVTIPTPERSQMTFTNGAALCSPAVVSMLVGFWAERLRRPELDRDVPAVARGVWDPQWPGMGNWSFNVAFAGSLPGLRAYVTRLTDVSELEDWIARGVPVGVSLCYNRLRGVSREPSGHLVVCVGFTRDGDVVVNDPGTRRNVRKTFPRRRLADAWEYSHHTVYLIYPAGAEVPADRFGHWDSPTTRPTGGNGG